VDQLSAVDPEVSAAIDLELVRQRGQLEMIASENFVSPAVMEAAGTVLTNKYAEGLPGKRYYGGCEHVDVVENLARDRAKELFGAAHANVQPHSGAQANMAACQALLSTGDRILGMNLSHGGHLTHGSPVNFSGILYEVSAYGVDSETGRIDYDALREQAKAERPRMIIAGASAYSRIIDFAVFSEIAKEVDAFLLVDMAHIAGLVAAGVHPTPVGLADVVTTTTHKTLRGPRGGLIMGEEQHAKALDKAVFPGTQGGPLMHVIAAKAVGFREALQPAFREYARQVVTNAQALAEQLMARGVSLVSGGTDNHLVLVDLTGRDLTGKDAERVLEDAGITVNKNTVPGEQRSPFVTSGLRIGSAALTTRGMTAADFTEIGNWIADLLERPEDEALQRQIRGSVSDLCLRHSLYPSAVLA